MVIFISKYLKFKNKQHVLVKRVQKTVVWVFLSSLASRLFQHRKYLRNIIIIIQFVVVISEKKERKNGKKLSSVNACLIIIYTAVRSVPAAAAVAPTGFRIVYWRNPSPRSRDLQQTAFFTCFSLGRRRRRRSEHTVYYYIIF